jgi:hypothetical protein
MAAKFAPNEIKSTRPLHGLFFARRAVVAVAKISKGISVQVSALSAQRRLHIKTAGDAEDLETLTQIFCEDRLLFRVVGSKCDIMNESFSKFRNFCIVSQSVFVNATI